jgi:hypothetical protein
MNKIKTSLGEIRYDRAIAQHAEYPRFKSQYFKEQKKE